MIGLMAKMTVIGVEFSSLVQGAQWKRRARDWARMGIDAVLPPRCLACDQPVDVQGRMCLACWEQITFIGEPLCAQCGLPFELSSGRRALCGRCARLPSRFDRARAAFLYEGVGRDLVLAFKMADRTWLAPALADMLRRAAAPLLPEADVIAPVPLHRRRLFARRFNQSALLARGLSGESGHPLAVDLMERTRRTTPQASLSAAERRRNVRGAFMVRERRRAVIAGRRVLLVDDVMTSGATAGACAHALKRAGARAVDVVTLARTALPGP